MKKTGGVLNLKKINFFKLLGNDKLSFFISASLVIGLLLGILLFSPKNNISYFSGLLFNYYIKGRIGKPFFELLFQSILIYFSVDFLLMFFGVSAFGVIIIPLYLSALGFALGGMVSYSYYTYALKGIVINATMLIPTSILFFAGIIRVAKTFFDVSLSLTQLLFLKGNSRLFSNKFSNLFKEIFLLILFTVAVALIDSLFSNYLINILGLK